MRDKYQRNLTYLRVSVTDFCNFRCSYCMPPEGVEAKKREELLTLEEIYYIVHLFVEKGVTKVRLTGGEPLLRKNILGLIESLAKIEKIKDLSMTTNAHFLKDVAQDLKQAGLQRLNISLDTLDPVKFSQITGGGDFARVWEGIEAALDQGLGVKLNTVLLKGVNDDEIQDLMALTQQYPIDVRFIEAMPIGPTKDYSQEKFLACDYVLSQGELEPVPAQDPSATARLYQLPGAKGRVGLIRPLSDHFCQVCNRLRLTSVGEIKPCLLSDQVIPLREAIRAGEDIRPLIDQAVNTKPERHHVDEGESTNAAMSSIGG